MPLYIVGKEISLEDVRLALEKMPDRFFEHPATVLVLTNMYYSEAPWLTPNSVTAATSLVWHEVGLPATPRMISSSRSPSCSLSWPRTGAPRSARPAATRSTRSRWCWCSIARITNSCSTSCGRGAASRAPITIWSSPRSPIAPAPRSSSRRRRCWRRWRARSAPGGRLIGIHSHGARSRASRSSSRSGRARTRSRTDRHQLLRAVKAELGPPGAISISTPMPMRARCSATTCTRCRARSARIDRHLDAVRRLERGDLRRADRGPAAVGR